MRANPCFGRPQCQAPAGNKLSRLATNSTQTLSQEANPTEAKKSLPWSVESRGRAGGLRNSFNELPLPRSRQRRSVKKWLYPRSRPRIHWHFLRYPVPPEGGAVGSRPGACLLVSRDTTPTTLLLMSPSERSPDVLGLCNNIGMYLTTFDGDICYPH